MKTKFAIIFLTVISCLSFSCRDKSIVKKDNENFSQNKKEIEFKKWLKDTLFVLKKTAHNEHRRIISVSEDSLSLDISKSYDTILTFNKTTKERELNYAIDLLKRNKVFPKGKFNFKMIILQSYSTSMVRQLTYDYDYEIKQFFIKEKNTITQYNFVKGNLVEKKIINPNSQQ